MHLKPLPLGLIVFGLLALGGAVDGVRRQFVRDPLWAMQNWARVLTGAAIWLVVGGVAVAVGVVAELA